MRDRISTALEVLGFAGLSAAAYMVDLTLGVAATGASLLVIGIGLGR